MASFRSGIATRAVLDFASKHTRLEKYLTQGSTRATLRSVGVAQKAKAKTLTRHYNLRNTPFSTIGKIRARFQTKVAKTNRGSEALERWSGPVGIPLRDYSARFTKKGASFAIVKGKRHFMPSGFTSDDLGGSHVFRRNRAGDGGLVGRLPISKRFGPGLPLLLDNREVAYQGRQAYNRRIVDEIRKEENRAFKRAGLR